MCPCAGKLFYVACTLAVLRIENACMLLCRLQVQAGMPRRRSPSSSPVPSRRSRRQRSRAGRSRSRRRRRSRGSRRRARNRARRSDRSTSATRSNTPSSRTGSSKGSRSAPCSAEAPANNVEAPVGVAAVAVAAVAAGQAEGEIEEPEPTDREIRNFFRQNILALPPGRLYRQPRPKPLAKLEKAVPPGRIGLLAASCLKVPPPCKATGYLVINPPPPAVRPKRQ